MTTKARKIIKKVDAEQPDGFEDCITKVAYDCAKLRLKTVKTFSDVMEWNEPIFTAAMTLSMALEIIGHANALTDGGEENDTIRFVDDFAKLVKSQVRGEAVEIVVGIEVIKGDGKNGN